VRKADRSELERIAHECFGAELAEHVGAHEQVHDAEHPQLRIAEDTGGDDRHASLQRVLRRDRGRKSPCFIGPVRDADELPALSEVGEDRLLERASLSHQKAPEIERLVVAVIGPVRDADELPALREVGEDRLLERASLPHQEAPQIEGLVVAGQLIVARKTVDRRVFVEPVEQQIVPAPVARLAGGDPVEPVEVGLRIARQAVVAQHDRVAADRDR